MSNKTDAEKEMLGQLTRADWLQSAFFDKRSEVVRLIHSHSDGPEYCAELSSDFFTSLTS